MDTASTTTTTSSAASPVAITYSKNGAAPVTEHFDFLVVACDPRSLALSERTALEARVTNSLTSFTFRTSLYRAARPKRKQLVPGEDGDKRVDEPAYAVRFHPGKLSAQDGEVYGFRDEVMARAPDYRPSSNGITWATTYQLEGEGLVGRNAAEVAKALDQKRDRVISGDDLWLDFKPEPGQPEEAVLVDYFPHFNAADLAAGLPWLIKEHQGENNTLYVSSFTCFESVLHCYLYANEIMKEGGSVMTNRFPRNKNARIAVCGAGPSGILFASQHLVKKGYHNFTIFEPQDRFGGKTFTYHRPAPAVPSRDVPCELGTCYLSLGYEPMFHLFSDYDAGEVVALDKDTNLFRSIIDDKVAKTQEERENGVEYGAWTLRKNGPWEFFEQLEVYVAGIRYLIVHYATMGMTINDCMPTEPPTELNILDNLERLVRLALTKSDTADVGDDAVPAKDLYAVLKDEKRDDRSTGPKGLFDLMDDFSSDLRHATNLVPVNELKKACRNVFNTTFAKFLDDNKMGQLKSIFIYAYQVQGYGTIERIPAYYGMIWITPGVLTGDIRQLFDKSAAASKRGTVNVVTKGWLTLWEKMVEKDLKGKVMLNAKITAVDRVLSK